MVDNENPPEGFEEYLLAQEHPVPATEAPPEGFEDHLKELQSEKYGSPLEMAKTAAEGLAEGIAGPLAPMAQVGLGISSKEDIKARAEENPIVKGGAELTGMMLPIPGSQARLLTKAGEGVVKGLGMANKAGWVAKAGEGAVRGAIEAGIFQGGKELSEAYMRDPNEVADNAVADIGLASVLGGVFGGAFGAAAGALSKEGKTLVSQADVPALEAGDLKTIISSDATLSASKKNSLLDSINIGKKKANAPEIEAAATELGLPHTPAMTLENPAIQMQVDALSNSPYSIAGNRVRTQLDAADEGVETVLRGATSSSSNLSREELGSTVVKSLDDQIRAAYAPQKAAFEELAALHESIPVEADAIEGLAKAFSTIKEVKLSPNTQEGRLVREVLDLAANVKTAEDLSTIRNMASLKQQGAGPDPMGWLKSKIRDELAALQEESIRRYSKSFPRNDEVGALFASKLEMAETARANYKPYIKKLGQLSEWLGKGKIRGTEDALHFMNEKLSATDVAKRLFSSSKDPEFIKFFSKEFPEQFALMRDYQRQELIEASMREGMLSPKAFFSKFNALEPELQNSLYTKEEIKKIKALELYVKEAFPKNFNRSGTSHVTALREAAASPKGLIRANVRDFAMEKMIQLAEKGTELHNAHAMGKATARGWKMASDSAKAVFNASKELPAKVIPLAAHREKLDKLVVESTKNPERLFGINDNNPAPEYNEAFAATSGRAVAYLNSLRPKTDPQAPLDSKQPPSKTQMAAYNRALDIAQQPLVTMKYLKDGTITTQDVTSLRTIYPNLYNQLASKLMAEMVEAKAKKQTIPYQTKMSLSVFLGQPLDSTLTPMGIMAAQPSPEAQAQSQPQGNKPPAYNSVKGLDSLAKGTRTPAQASQERSTSGK